MYAASVALLMDSEWLVLVDSSECVLVKNIINNAIRTDHYDHFPVWYAVEALMGAGMTQLSLESSTYSPHST